MSTTEHTAHHRHKVASERSFGLTFAAVFLLVAAWPLMHGEGPRVWALGVAVCFGGLGLFRANWLALPSRLWARLGDAMSRVVSPIALGVLFFGVFTPAGILMRRLRKDPLRLRLDPGARSYWIERSDPVIDPASFRDQF